MTDPRDRVAHQIGLLILGNIELSTANEQLTAQLQQVQQRLHEALADAKGPSGAVTPPDIARGN